MDLDPIERNVMAQGKAFRWHELVTPDVPKALEFYKNALGFEVTNMDMGGGNVYHMLGRDGESLAGVVEPEEQSNGKTGWLSYIRVDDVDSAVAACERHGGKVLTSAFDIPTVGRIAFVADPFGAKFYLFRPNPNT